tara:strand:+ start:469 stop:855 length:387 start_codon:yes stop_codon:yes gene_type:complete
MSKTKRGIPAEVKREEGRKLKAIWERTKDDKGLTQESYCAAIGLNQGMLQQMFRGSSPIPLDTLLNLSISLDFDPRDVRPDLDTTYKKMALAIGGVEGRAAARELESMSDEGRKEVEALITAAESSLE